MTPAVEDLMDVLQPIGEQMGVAVAMDMVRHYGGTRLYVPKTWRDGLDINALGIAVAQDLCRLFGPETIDIPMQPWGPDALARIAGECAGRGLTGNEIARMLGVSWKTVARYIRAAPKRPRERRRVDPRQIDLEELLTKGN